jgi:pimeloyl-ACP methyl ester carboxylesterase
VPRRHGHSWGGTVITEAGVHPKVAGLVYVSALALDAGETTSQQYEGFAATPDFVIDVGPDGYGFLNQDKFKAGFAADASDADAAFLRDSQVPIDMAVFGTPVKNAAWRDKPSWAVIATEDRAFDQAMLQHMAEGKRDEPRTGRSTLTCTNRSRSLTFATDSVMHVTATHTVSLN